MSNAMTLEREPFAITVVKRVFGTALGTLVLGMILVFIEPKVHILGAILSN